MNTDLPSPTPVVSGTRWKTGLLVLLAGLLPLLLHAYSLKLPFLFDDYLLYAKVSGNGYIPDSSLYDLINREVVQEHPQLVPWWTSPDAKLRFLRPLTGLSLQADYRMWGKNPWGYHLTNLILLGMSCVFLFLSGRFLLRDNRAAFLGTFIFSNHLCISTVVPWVAERGSVLSLFWGLTGLYAHIRFRNDEKRWWEVVAWACFILAFLSRESGAVCLVVYFLYDLILWQRDKPGKWPGILRLGTYYAALCIPLGLFVAYFVLSGYGVAGSYSLLDGDGPLFMKAAQVLMNVVLYVLGLLFFVPLTPDVNRLLFDYPLLLGLLIAACFLAALFFYPGIRKKLLRNRTVLFLGSWMFVSLLPCIQLLPQNRYLFAATAPFGLFVSFYLFQIKRTHGFGRFSGFFFYALAFYFAVFPVAGVIVKSSTVQRLYEAPSQIVRDTLAKLDHAEPPAQVFFLNMPNAAMPFALQHVFDFYSEKGRVRAFPLSIARDLPRVEVVGDHSLLITSESAPFLEDAGERMFMTDRLNREGLTRSNTYFTSTIETVEEGHIFGIRYDFASPLDAPFMKFFFIKGREVIPVEIPRGARGRVTLPESREEPGV